MDAFLTLNPGMSIPSFILFHGVDSLHHRGKMLPTRYNDPQRFSCRKPSQKDSDGCSFKKDKTTRAHDSSTLGTTARLPSHDVQENSHTYEVFPRSRGETDALTQPLRTRIESATHLLQNRRTTVFTPHVPQATLSTPHSLSTESTGRAGERREWKK